MSQLEHTPTPWKVVSVPNFSNGLVYTSIQPVDADEEAKKQLAMMNGEFHVCRMNHTAAEWRFNYHRANAAFIVKAVNAYESNQALIAKLQEALERLVTEAKLDGMDKRAGWDAWIAMADEALALSAASVGLAREERAHQQEARV